MRVVLSLACAVPLLLAGCEPPKTEFVYDQRTLGLLDDARDKIQETLLDSFGTPKTGLVGWQRLPVNYGGYAGKVAGVAGESEDGKIGAIQVSFEGDAGGVSKGQTLVWTTGAYRHQSVRVTAFDSETGLLGFTPPLDEAPKLGDQFIVDFGRTLKNARKLYAEHCQHCHGVSGDGNGPTARYLNPLPRDYRKGKFKFTSTDQNERPSRDDLSRIIRQGLPGTYMPSFMLLEADERTAIIEYVRWLSMRGEYENYLLVDFETDFTKEALKEYIKREQEKAAAEGGERPSREDLEAEILDELKEILTEFDQTADDASKDLAAYWAKADLKDSIVFPSDARVEDDAQSRARGRKLFAENCAACHGITGRGDGPQTEDFNDIPGVTPPVKYDKPGLFDDWGSSIKPRDLTRGIYRGGRRPLDIYRRIYVGIKGTPMPPFKGKFQDDDKKIWDLVNYVMQIPFEPSDSKSTTAPSEVAAQGKPKTGT